MSADPAATSAMAAALSRSSRELRSQAAQLQSMYAELRLSWVGPAATRASRRADLMSQALTAAADEMQSVATTLQSQSAAMADLAGAERLLQERARAAGQILDESGVHPAPGIRGLVDAEQLAREEATRATLECDWAELQERRAHVQISVTRVLADSRLTPLAMGLRTG